MPASSSCGHAEIPARREVHTYGARIEEASADEAPGCNRLKMGITWGVVSDFLSKRAKSEKPFPSMQLSLMLDALIDIGVAVPILADRDGTFFRAYRHGEDALFAENEAALAYLSQRGFSMVPDDPTFRASRSKSFWSHCSVSA
ncbi:hypothetical protein [Sphingomonas phyllosphaerae]|uniref:hypothetical protein n=1 Tax=Sphingomonas phyllosphaerae TaxID=257003 RepID=UPI002FF602E6